MVKFQKTFFAGIFFVTVCAVCQIFIPMAFWGPKIFVASNASTVSVECPATVSGTLTITLPYSSIIGNATTCQVTAQNAVFVGVPLCSCTAGVCTTTGLTIANTFLATMGAAGVSGTITNGITYKVGNAKETSSPGSTTVVVTPQTWSQNCLGSMLKLWASSIDTTTVTSSYNTTAEYATGTFGNSTFTSSVPPTYPVGSQIKINGNAQAYSVTAETLSGAGNFNGSFEKPVMVAATPNNYEYFSSMNATDKAAFGWIATGGAVVFGNGSAWGYPNVPTGTQGLSMQGTASVGQSINFPSSGTITMTWQAINRPPSASYAINPYTVTLDGVVVGGPYSQSSITVWQANSLNISIGSPGYHTIAFNTSPVGPSDYNVGIDNVHLSSTVTVTPNLVTNYNNAEVSVLGVSQWNDKSIYGNNLTQLTSPSNYPAWSTNYNGTGKAALLFNGGSLYLYETGSSLVSGTNGSSVYVIGAQTAPSGASTQYALGYGGVGAGGSRNLGKDVNTFAGVLSTNGTDLTLPVGTWSAALGLISSTFASAQISGSMNGNTSATTAVAFNTSSSDIYVGRGAVDGNYWAGALFEILVVDYGMNGDERVMVEGFLAAKYGITGQLPAGHKYKTIPP